MKKLFLLLGLLFVASFAVFGVSIHASEPEVEGPETEEVIVIEDEAIGDEVILDEDAPVLEEETGIFLNELNLTLASIFAWIGGISGLGAVFAFALRFIKDRQVMKEIRDKFDALTASDATGNEALELSLKRNESLEKAIVSLVNISNADPEIKKAALESLSTSELISASLAHLTEKAIKNEKVKVAIAEETESLLKKLAKERV